MGKPGSVSKAEPRFDLDLAYGRKGEIHISEMLDAIISGNGKIEIKTKRILDLYFYVETHCDKGRTGSFGPSGINVTTADTWAFVLGKSMISIFIPTRLIRSMLCDASSRDKNESDGSCPTRGKLINLGALLARYKRESDRAQSERKPADVPEIVERAPLRREDIVLIQSDDIRWG